MFFLGSEITANEVTSLPVPLVEGIAIKYGSYSGRKLRAKRRTHFARSIAEPPPTAITQGDISLKRAVTPPTTLSVVGSGITSE